MANYVIHKPTELELQLTAERKAADDASKAAVRAEYQRILDERDASLKAATKHVPTGRTAPEPHRVAAEALRAALNDDAWAALLRYVEVWNAPKFAGALKFIAQGEAAMAYREEQARGARERSERQAAEEGAAQAALEARAAELVA